MKYVKPKGREKIELLKKLLDKEYTEREDLGRSLHGKKNTLYVLSHNLTRFENQWDSKNTTRNLIAEQKALTSQLLDDLQEVRRNIFPSLLNFGGLLVALRECFAQMKSKTGLEVIIEYNQKDENLLGSNKDFGIYFTCAEIVEYLSMSGAKKVLFKIKIKKDFFDISIEVLGKTKIVTNNAVENKLETIKGLIIWKDINVLATNLQTIFKLRFLSHALV